MPKLTVGIPVFNGEDNIEACLTSVLGQSFDDMVVLVFDNNSTDRTGDIVRNLARTDPRLQYFRNEDNIGPVRNFMKALNAAKTEYFAWRADDDLSSDNYFELLVDALERRPDAALAASHVELKIGNVKVDNFPYDCNQRKVRLLRILTSMFHHQASWIYGVWRTRKLLSYYLRVSEHYPDALGHDGWAHDRLVLLHAMLDEAITGTDQAVFCQRINVRSRDGYSKMLRSQYSRRIEYHNWANGFKPGFITCCKSALNERRWNGVEKLVLNAAIRKFTRNFLGSRSEFRMTLLRLERRLFED